MSALQIAVDLLKDSSEVIDIVTENRVYPVVAPQNAAVPYVIVSLASGNDEQLLSGAARIYTSRIQVDCLAASAALSMTLGDAVGEALEDVVKAAISGFIADVMRDGVDFTDFSDDRTAFRRVIGFTVIWKTEPSPESP